MTKRIKIIGGGLAGVESAYQLLKRGHIVDLYEMRPKVKTPAHQTDKLAELVCSNSLKSDLKDTASGLLKVELRTLDSLVLKCAEKAKVEAGSALAVDKKIFSEEVEKVLNSFENFNLINEEVTEINTCEYTIIASGPLTSNSLADKIKELTGQNHMYFYDAVAPVIDYDTINFDKAFFASRYNKGTSDYINCPMERDEYEVFYNELINANCVPVKDFDKKAVFESCMPIEIMAKRGQDSIRFGPLKPVGIFHPMTDKKYYAVVQLRKENKSGTMYNMVGFQTHLTFGEQKRVFSLIPGLENAEFLRYGVMHRNTFIESPKVLDETQNFKDTNLYFAGQITGVEGYMESVMSGLLAGINLDRKINNLSKVIPPNDTICGALSRFISAPNVDFQPMNANFGVLPKIAIRNKKERKIAYSNRAIESIAQYSKEVL